MAISIDLGWQSQESWGGNHNRVGVAITRELGWQSHSPERYFYDHDMLVTSTHRIGIVSY